MANVFSNLPATTGNGTGAAVDTSTMGRERTFTVQDTFKGTVIIEFSNEGAAGPWAQLTTFTQAGKQTLEIAGQFMRVRRSGVPTIAPGLPNVDVASNDSGGLFFDLPATTGNGTGATIDVSTLGTFNTITVLDTFRGTVVVEISEDGIDFATCMTFNGPDFQSKEFVAQFMRIVRKNVPGVSPGLPNIDVGAINDSTPGGTTTAQKWTIVGPVVADPAPVALNSLVKADPSGGAFPITLPAISADNAGEEIVVKNVTSSILAITVTPTGGDTIDSAATFVITTGFASITLASDGSGNWDII